MADDDIEIQDGQNLHFQIAIDTVQARDPSSSARGNRRPHSPKHKRRTSYSVKDFYEQLGVAALFAQGKVDGKLYTEEKAVPLYTSQGTGRHGPTIRIRSLQHMTVVYLRREIAFLVEEIVRTKTTTPELMEQVRKTMEQYVQALRDLKYMLEDPSADTNVSSYMKGLLFINAYSDGAIMADAGLLDPHENSPLNVSDYTGIGGMVHEEKTEKQRTKEFFDRLGMALFGGAVLIAPMLIMRLHPTLVAELVTTSVFVLAFGIILAWFMTDGDRKDVLGATAAYAAVLVVFIGTSS